MSEREPRFLNSVRSIINWPLVVIVTFIFSIVVTICSLFLFIVDRSRKNIHLLVSAWAKTVLLVCPLMNVRLEGEERLVKDGVYVFVANHQSLADIVAVLHLKRPFKFIAKKELFSIPIFGWSLSAAGYIPLIRGNQNSGKEALEQACRYLERKVSVLFFPEGTRSLSGEIQNFKMGAFKLASELNISVVPIVIHGTRDLLPKGSRLMGRSEQVTVQIELPHQPKGKDASSIERFAGEIRNEMIQRLNQIRSHIHSGPL